MPQLPAIPADRPGVVARVRDHLAGLGAEVRLGDPVGELAGRPPAATWAPVPGWKRRAAAPDVVALYPWRWLRRPGSDSLRSFSAWVRR